MLFVVVSGAPVSPFGDRHELRLCQRVGDRRRDLRQHLDLAVAEVRLAAGLNRLIHLLNAFRCRLGDLANANRLGVRRRFGLEAHARRVGFRLRDLRRVELGDAHETGRFLPLRFRLRDERRVRRFRLLELALLVRDRTLGLELRFLRAARLVRRHDVRVRLRLGGRLPATRFGDFRLHDLDVERIEDQSEVGELARARLCE